MPTVAVLFIAAISDDVGRYAKKRHFFFVRSDTLVTRVMRPTRPTITTKTTTTIITSVDPVETSNVCLFTSHYTLQFFQVFL